MKVHWQIAGHLPEMRKTERKHLEVLENFWLLYFVLLKYVCGDICGEYIRLDYQLFYPHILYFIAPFYFICIFRTALFQLLSYSPI